MKIENVSKKIRCEIPNCKGMATVKIVKEGFLRTAGLYLCEDCERALYKELAKRVVPKSPTNVFNKTKGSNKK